MNMQELRREAMAAQEALGALREAQWRRLMGRGRFAGAAQRAALARAEARSAAAISAWLGALEARG